MTAATHFTKPRSQPPASTLITFSRKRRACGMRWSVALRVCWHWTRGSSNGFDFLEGSLTGATPNAHAAKLYGDKNRDVRPHRTGGVWVVHGDLRGRIQKNGMDEWSRLSHTMGIVSRINRPSLGVIRRL